MTQPKDRRRRRVRLGLLVVTSIGVITLDLRDAAAVDGARRAVATVLAPAQRVADTAVEPVRDAWRGATRYGELEAENRRLRDDLRELRAGPVRADVAEAQLASLLAANDLPWATDVPRRVARVVGGPRSNFSHELEIDRGSADGIEVGMPVVVGGGLVGRVQQVTRSEALVQILTDPDLRVGVKVPTGPFGTARGTGDGERLLVDTSLDAGSSPEEGAIVLTSGDPQHLPTGDPGRHRPGQPAGRQRAHRRPGGGAARRARPPRRRGRAPRSGAALRRPNNRPGDT